MIKHLSKISKSFLFKTSNNLRLHNLHLLNQKMVYFNRNTADTFLNEGLKHMIEGKRTKALEYFSKSIIESPEYSEGYHKKGAILGLLGQNNEALIQLNKSLEFDPNQYVVLYNKGTILQQQGKKTEALECFNKSIDLNPNYYGSHYNKALLLSELGNNEEALESANKCIELNPMCTQAYLLKAEIIFKNIPDRSSSEFDFLSGLYVNPKDLIYLQFNEIYGYYKTSRITKLENENDVNNIRFNSIQKAIELNPSYYQLYFYKGVILRIISLNRNQEAIQSLNKAIELNPEFIDSYFEKAKILCEEQKFDEAIECINTIIQKDNSNQFAFTFKCMILAIQGKFDEARSYFQMSISINTNEFYTFYYQLILLQKLGFTNEALSLFKKMNQQFEEDILRERIKIEKSANGDNEVLIFEDEIKFGKELQNFYYKKYDSHYFCYGYNFLFHQDELEQIQYTLKPNSLMLIQNDFENLLRTAELHYKNQEYFDLLKSSIKLIEINPSIEKPHFLKKEALEKLSILQGFDVRFLYLRNQIQSNPQNFEAYTEKGQILYYLDRLEEALESISKALEINPNYLQAIKIIIPIYIRLGKYNEALQSFIKEVTLDQEFTNNIINKQGEKLNLEQEQEKEGFKRYNERFEYMYHSNLDNAKSCMIVQQNQDALEYINKAILLKPNDPQAHHLKRSLLKIL